MFNADITKLENIVKRLRESRYLTPIESIYSAESLIGTLANFFEIPETVHTQTIMNITIYPNCSPPYLIIDTEDCTRYMISIATIDSNGIL